MHPRLPICVLWLVLAAGCSTVPMDERPPTPPPNCASQEAWDAYFAAARENADKTKYGYPDWAYAAGPLAYIAKAFAH